MPLLPTDFDYIDYADATGQIRCLPVAKGTPCSARPNPADLTPAQKASLLPGLPPAPVGKFWRRKNCIVTAGLWEPYLLEGDSFVADQTEPTEPTDPPVNPTPGVVNGEDRAGEDNQGISESYQNVN